MIGINADGTPNCQRPKDSMFSKHTPYIIGKAGWNATQEKFRTACSIGANNIADPTGRALALADCDNRTDPCLLGGAVNELNANTNYNTTPNLFSMNSANLGVLNNQMCRENACAAWTAGQGALVSIMQSAACGIGQYNGAYPPTGRDASCPGGPNAAVNKPRGVYDAPYNQTFTSAAQATAAGATMGPWPFMIELACVLSAL